MARTRSPSGALYGVYAPLAAPMAPRVRCVPRPERTPPPEEPSREAGAENSAEQPDIYAPRRFRRPRTTFGAVGADERGWAPPPDGADAMEVEAFRMAVIQHAITSAVRAYKRHEKWTQRYLAEQDGRWIDHTIDESQHRRQVDQATRNWMRKLNGHDNLTLQDLSVILRVFPEGVLPDEREIRRLLAVAEGLPRPGH